MTLSLDSGGAGVKKKTQGVSLKITMLAHILSYPYKIKALVDFHLSGNLGLMQKSHKLLY